MMFGFGEVEQAGAPRSFFPADGLVGKGGGGVNVAVKDDDAQKELFGDGSIEGAMLAVGECSADLSSNSACQGVLCGSVVVRVSQ